MEENKGKPEPDPRIIRQLNEASDRHWMHAIAGWNRQHHLETQKTNKIIALTGLIIAVAAIVQVFFKFLDFFEISLSNGWKDVFKVATMVLIVIIGIMAWEAHKLSK